MTSASADIVLACPEHLQSTQDAFNGAPYRLTGIRDLFPAGRWSVDMFAMFHCGRLDILPVGDLGVRKGFQALYKLKVCVTPYASAPVSPECSTEGQLQLLAAFSHES